MAYFELSKSVLKEKYNSLKDICNIIAYNHKANPDVGKVLENETNCLLVMSSLPAISDIKDKSRIIYIIQGENQKEIETLYEQNITSFIVDNEPDLNKVLSLNKPIKLYLRMKFKEHTVYTGKYFVYGLDWQKTNDLIPSLAKNKNIIQLGLHLHRRTQNVGEWNLLEEFKDAIAPENFKLIKVINIGGGIPVNYANSNPDTKIIFERINELKEYLNKNNIELMLEPGRYLCGPSIRLISYIKNIYENNLILDCSIFNAYMDTYLLHMRLPVLNEDKGQNLHRYLLKGCSPDSLDIFRYTVNLTEKKVGDKIIFENAGAYNFHTEFAELPKLETKILDKFN